MSRTGHQPWPLAALSHYQSPVFLARLEALTRVRTEAMGYIGQVEKAIAKITAKAQAMQAALTALCAKKAQELQAIKMSLSRYIIAGLEEVERTLSEKWLLLMAQYGPLLRENIGKAASLQLFRCTIEASSLQILQKVDFKVSSP